MDQFRCFQILRALLAAGIIAFGSPWLSAENLTDVYQLALKNDPRLRAAKATFKADSEVRKIARGGLLPNLSIGGDMASNEQASDGVDSEPFKTSSYSATLSQSLFRLDRWFQFQQGKFISRAAGATFAYEQQNTIIRIAEAYLNVLRAGDNLTASKAQEMAIKRQYDQVRQRFRAGLTAITDVHEAQLQADLSKVGRINAENQLGVAKEALAAIVGASIPLLSRLVDDYPVASPMPTDPQQWVQLGLQGNQQLLAARLQHSAARQNSRSKFSNHLPQVDLVASYRLNKTDKDYFFVPGDSVSLGGRMPPEETEATNFSVRWALPLWAGGALHAERRKASAERAAAREQALLAERGTIQEIRSLHNSVRSAVANVAAHKQAITSSESALEATRVGYEVGTRNIVDLLQAERGLYSARRDYAYARYDYIIQFFNLKRAVGTLSPEDIFELNEWLR